MVANIRGQLLIDINGLVLSEEDKEVLQHPRVSGVVLFAKNFANSEQLKSLCKSISVVRKNLIIFVDQEGGRVQRFASDGFQKLEPLSYFRDIAENNVEQAMIHARKQGMIMSEELLAHGVDACFGPVLDCDAGNKSKVMQGRCFSSDPLHIIKIASNYLSGMMASGMFAVGKHFPGHGGVCEDTHLETSIDNRELSAFLEKDILPYIALQSAMQGIMLSHICYPKIDDMPCSLSEKWVNIIKKDLQLRPVLITDCMSMQSAVNFIPDPVERVFTSFSAGVDLVVYCNDRNSVVKVLDSLPPITNFKLLDRLKSFKITNL